MSDPWKPRPSVGKIILGIVLALAVGAAFPFLTVYQVMLPLALPGVATMISVALAASIGWGSAALLWVVGLAISLLGLGPELTAAIVPMSCLPAVVMILGIRRQKPFFAQLRTALAACLGGAVLAVSVAAAFYGGDMIQRLMELLQSALETLLPEMWKGYKGILQTAGVSMTYDEFASTFYSTLKVMQLYYETYLPANLLTGAVWTATISTLWGNWLAARRGMATSASFAGLHEWKLPANLTWGILMTLAAAFALQFTSLPGADAAWVAVEHLAMAAFTLQALGANDRRLKSGGATVSRRAGSVVLLILLGGIVAPLVLGLSMMTLLGIVGAFSALFGRYGALRPWIDKHKNDMNGSGQ